MSVVSMSETAAEEFCSTNGMTMTMFMDGFHSSLVGFVSSSSNSSSSSSNNNDDSHTTTTKPLMCLYYFVNTWKLDDRSKFQGAMVFTVLLAILVEGLSAVRGCIIKYYSTTTTTTLSSLSSRRNHKSSSSSLLLSSSASSLLLVRHVLLTICYGLQGLLGYILMLITMSFSIELVASVIIGLMIGNILFMRYDDDDNDVPTTYTYNYNYNTNDRTTSGGDDDDYAPNTVGPTVHVQLPPASSLLPPTTPLTMLQTNQSVQGNPTDSLYNMMFTSTSSSNNNRNIDNDNGDDDNEDEFRPLLVEVTEGFNTTSSAPTSTNNSNLLRRRT